MKKILLTGGLGYIGSHTAVELLQNDYDIVIVDNLSNCRPEVKESIEKITNKKFKFIEEDLLNKNALFSIFEQEKFDAVIHFAAAKAVGESVENPLKYYNNNVVSSVNLLEAMKKHNVKNLIFSSSACVYGDSDNLPYDENMPANPTNPYGRTKYFIEEMMKDVYHSDNTNNFIILRYFNPVGAHDSHLIGEDCERPANLMPLVARAATGKMGALKVFGNDYDTPDGTGVRDYIHVVDLSIGHLKALEKIADKNGFLDTYNLGSGKGFSVLELINTFNELCGGKVKYEVVEKRPGDAPASYASAVKAEKELNWKAARTLKDMCESSYKFELRNENK